MIKIYLPLLDTEHLSISKSYFMQKIGIIVLGWMLLMSSNVVAQEIWDLEKCITYAMENSTEVQSAELGIQNADLLAKQARQARLPSLNANTNYGWNFGRQVDPSTNDFVSTQLSFNSVGIGTSVTLFNGGNINNGIKQSKLDLEAAKLDGDALVNNLQLSIAQSYVLILLAEEQVTNSRARLVAAQQQLENTDKQIAAGTIPRNDRLQILANMATEEQNIIVSENSVAFNYNQLKQFMQLDPNYPMKVAKPDIEIPVETSPDKISFEILYANALKSLPEVKSQELKLQSAEIGVDLAKANLYPSLSLNANIGSNYSSLGRKFENTGDTFVATQPAVINGTPGTIGFEQPIIDVSDNLYLDQLNENFGQGITLGLNIPIFNGSRAKIGVERSKLQIENLKVQQAQTLNQIKSNVQRALNDARAAQLQLDASRKALEAQQANYDNVEKRYNLGAISTFEYITAKNTLDAAQLNETISRYDYIFKAKVLDFYMGRRLTIN